MNLFLSGRIWTKMVEIPGNIIYYKLKMSSVHSININLVSQDHKAVHHLNEKLTVVLHIKTANLKVDLKHNNNINI